MRDCELCERRLDITLLTVVEVCVEFFLITGYNDIRGSDKSGKFEYAETVEE